MIPFKKALTSSVGHKLLMALSGLFLLLFIVAHLGGNLTLYFPNPEIFNAYCEKMESLGPLKIVIEFGLLGLFLFHIFMAFTLKRNHWAARPHGYRKHETKGADSHFGFIANNMILTGAVLTLFLILHIWQFRFGPSVTEGYVTTLPGHAEPVRDFYRLVKETYQTPIWVAVYVAAMVFLGMHLRHGFWSVFQSLGVLGERCAPAFKCIAVAFAVAIAAGFIGIPLYFFVNR